MGRTNDTERLGEALEKMRAAVVLEEGSQSTVFAQPHCSVCDDTGVVFPDVPEGHPWYRKTMPCTNPDCFVANENRRVRAEKLYTLARVPETYERFTFETWNAALSSDELKGKGTAYCAARMFADYPNDAWALSEAARRYMNVNYPEHDERSSLVLYGKFGLGKTGLLVSIVNHLAFRGVPNIYIRSQDLFGTVQETYRQDSEFKTRDLIEQAIEVPVLLLDDLNVAYPSPDKRDILEAIVRGRDGRGKPFVISTNCNRDEFFDHWGGRVGDIVHKAHWVPVVGKKLRKTVQRDVTPF